MRDDDEEFHGLLDDDPALDCILFEEMRKEEGKAGGKTGCLGGLLILVSPVIYGIVLLAGI
ncbi:hypothetical protein [Desulfobulbus alkaliphilus]|uniref:hypothetical protein n=1 Tax=Desulfobulbus alkaliphilus TaxID=869814 RepID=UPI0019624AE3|nr:hypothetical protein [Desulfobulbus alkaliphilus]MBM9535943.1 hypothetical protein [Desulfobulbus alkaliphilus]